MNSKRYREKRDLRRSSEPRGRGASGSHRIEGDAQPIFVIQEHRASSHHFDSRIEVDGVLKRSMTFDDPLRFVSHRNEDGEALFEQACNKGWEGLIAKDAHSIYRHGRSRDWLKFECSASQELVIGGFTAADVVRETPRVAQGS